MSSTETDATIPTLVRVWRRDRDDRPHYLEQTTGEGSPRRLTLFKEEHVIGRGDDADIPIASQRASRQHAVLARKGLDYVLRDNNSRNGVFLNGLRVHTVVLREGDVVQIGDCAFTYREG